MDLMNLIELFKKSDPRLNTEVPVINRLSAAGVPEAFSFLINDLLGGSGKIQNMDVSPEYLENVKRIVAKEIYQPNPNQFVRNVGTDYSGYYDNGYEQDAITGEHTSPKHFYDANIGGGVQNTLGLFNTVMDSEGNLVTDDYYDFNYDDNNKIFQLSREELKKLGMSKDQYGEYIRNLPFYSSEKIDSFKKKLNAGLESLYYDKFGFDEDYYKKIKDKYRRKKSRMVQRGLDMEYNPNPYNPEPSADYVPRKWRSSHASTSDVAGTGYDKLTTAEKYGYTPLKLLTKYLKAPFTGAPQGGSNLNFTFGDNYFEPTVGGLGRIIAQYFGSADADAANTKQNISLNLGTAKELYDNYR